MNLKKIIREEIDDFDWARADDVLPINKWEENAAKLFLDAFKNTEFTIELRIVAGVNSVLINDINGGNYSAIYLNGDSLEWRSRLYKDLQQAINICGEDCELTQKYKKILEIFNNYFFKKNVTESKEDDFDWARGDAYFTIDDIVGKKMLYRHSNLSQLIGTHKELNKIDKSDVILGDIRFDDGYSVEYLKGNKAYIQLHNGILRHLEMPMDDVVKYVNLGVWVLLDDNGNFLNDYAK